MGNVYSISSGGITIANQAVTLAFLNVDSDTVIEILRCWVGYAVNATSEMLRVQLVSQVTAFPTLTSFTPLPHIIAGPVSRIAGGTAGAAGTCGINASAEGAGAKTILIEDAFNVLNGYLWVPTEKEGPITLRASGSSGFGLHLPAAPASLTDWAFGITYREL